MKRRFEMPEIEITKFDVMDVITTSGEMDLESSGTGGSTNFGG